MRETPRCPQCGASLPQDAPAGLCPQCLVAAGLGNGIPAAAEFATSDYQPMATESPGTMVGHYKLLQRIGEGGFGVVYMAEQTEPVRRKVALKIIKPGMDTREVIARFEAERQALALMDHPNIARVLDAGTTDQGRPYFVMELVRGIPITQFCDDNKLASNERLELFITVCNAIQHAHQKGVIHRDIKPSNVMVTLHDGTPVPKVIDFGVAKATHQQLTERTMFTAYGQMIGTPQYMSPEQAEMSGLDVDTRSDIYSLGVLLYELLTGSPPLERERLLKAGYTEVQRLIREEEPHKPSTKISTLGQVTAEVASRRGTDAKKLIALLRGDLDWIVMRALEKNRNRRYETANEFALDVKRHLNDEPVVARPPSTMYRLSKLARRNKAAFAATTGIAAALVVGLAIATWGYVEADRQRDIARAAQGTAENERDKARDAQERAEAEMLRAESAEALAKDQAEKLGQQVYAINFGRALDAYSDKDLSEVQRRLDACPPEHRGWEWRRLKYLTVGSGWMIDTGFDRIWWMAISPNRQRVVTAHAVNHPELRGVLTMIEVQSGEIVWQNLDAHSDEAGGVSFSHDGKMLVSTADDGRVRLWESASGRHIRDLEGFRPGASIIHGCFSSDDRLVAAGGGDYRGRGAGDLQIRLWETITGRLVGTFEGHTGKIRRMVFSPDSRRLYSCDMDGTAIAWNVATQRPIYHIKTGGDAERMECVALSPDGSTLATVQANGRVKLWDSEDGAPLKTLGMCRPIGMTIAFSADGQRIAAGGGGGDLRVWEIATGKQISAPEGHADLIRGLAFAADSDVLISADGGGYVMCSHLGEQIGNQSVELPVYEGSVEAAVFSNDGQWLGTGDRFGDLIIWNTDTLEPTRRIESVARGLGLSMSLNHDGSLVATGTRNGKVHVFDSRSGDLRWSAEHGKPGNLFVAFSSSGDSLLSAGADGAVICWDALTGNSRVRRVLHRSPIAALKTSAAGLFATTSNDSEEVPLRIVVCDEALKPVHQRDISAVSVASYDAVALDQGGRRLAYAVMDRIYIEDIHEKNPATQLQAPHVVENLAFGREDQRLFSQYRSSDHVGLWNLATGEEIYRPRDSGPPVARSDININIFSRSPGYVVNRLAAVNPSSKQILVSSFKNSRNHLVLLETTAADHPRQRLANLEAFEWVRKNTPRMLPDGFGLKTDLLSGIAQETSLDDSLQSTVLRIAPRITPNFLGNGADVIQALENPRASKATKERARRWVEGVSQSEEVHLQIQLCAAYLMRGQLDAAEAMLDQAAQSDPVSVAEWCRTVGYYRAQAKQWTAAADLYAKAIALDPDSHEAWRFRGYALLAAEDERGYVENCQAMMQRFGNASDPTILERNAKLFAASDGLLSEDLLTTSAERYTQVVTIDTDNNWFRMAGGMATYRTAEYAKTVQWLEGNLDSGSSICRTISALYLAMAQHRLENNNAPETLRQAISLMNQVPNIDKDELWHDWIVCSLARDEAEALISGDGDVRAESPNSIPESSDE